MPTSQKFEFQNPSGEKLAGRIELPDSEPRAFAIFAHCFTCSKNVRAASRISRALAEEGIAVLRFDFTGLGNSEGDFSNTNFSSNIEDLVSAADELENQFRAPSLLIGHSLGGTASLAAGARIDSVKAIATIGSPADPEHVVHLFGNSLPAINSKGQHEVQLAGRPFTIKKQFVDDVRSMDADDTVSKLKCAVMIYHSPQDELVDIDQARITYERLRHPKNFISLDGADHMVSAERDSDFIATTLAAWAARYLENPVNNEADINRQLSATEEGTVHVRELSGFAQLVQTQDHELHADEPAKVGGSNTGMSPYDLLLASLGTCTSMTLRMYAKHKNWPLESIELTLKHSRIHAKDCENCDGESSMITRIEKDISVSGNLSNQQVERLKEIADKCPVQKTLINEKQIETSIKLKEILDQ